MSPPAFQNGNPSVRSAPLAGENLDPTVAFLQLTHTSVVPAIWRNASNFTVTRLRSSSGLANRIMKESTVTALLVSVSVQSIPLGKYQLWADSKRLPTSYVPAFTTNVIDFDASPGCWAGSAFDYVHFHVPRECIEDIAADWEISRIGSFRQAVIEDDLVLAQLTKNLLPSITRRDAYSVLALDQLQLLLAAHLLQRYGGIANAQAPASGGLASWQKRRAKELLMENLNGKIRLSRLAAECGLSESHFARAFKISFGTSAHRWLIERRVERAKELLAQTSFPLIDVAAKSGFGDQPSFTRTFHRIVGASPARWRRDHLSK
jgi:AraC family transcriptional regulator